MATTNTAPRPGRTPSPAGRGTDPSGAASRGRSFKVSSHRCSRLLHLHPSVETLHACTSPLSSSSPSSRALSHLLQRTRSETRGHTDAHSSTSRRTPPSDFVSFPTSTSPCRRLRPPPPLPPPPPSRRQPSTQSWRPRLPSSQSHSVL